MITFIRRRLNQILFFSLLVTRDEVFMPIILFSLSLSAIDAKCITNYLMTLELAQTPFNCWHLCILAIATCSVMQLVYRAECFAFRSFSITQRTNLTALVCRFPIDGSE